jgi:hypothetical protein
VWLVARQLGGLVTDLGLMGFASRDSLRQALGDRSDGRLRLDPGTWS